MVRTSPIEKVAECDRLLLTADSGSGDPLTGGRYMNGPSPTMAMPPRGIWEECERKCIGSEGGQNRGRVQRLHTLESDTDRRMAEPR